MITKNTFMRHFFIDGNRLGTEFVIMISDALRKNDTLLSIGLRENRLDYRAGAHLLDTLKGHPSLERLEVTDMEVSEDYFRLIKRELMDKRSKYYSILDPIEPETPIMTGGGMFDDVIESLKQESQVEDDDDLDSILGEASTILPEWHQSSKYEEDEDESSLESDGNNNNMGFMTDLEGSAESEMLKDQEELDRRLQKSYDRFGRSTGKSKDQMKAWEMEGVPEATRQERERMKQEMLIEKRNNEMERRRKIYDESLVVRGLDPSIDEEFKEMTIYDHQRSHTPMANFTHSFNNMFNRTSSAGSISSSSLKIPFTRSGKRPKKSQVAVDNNLKQDSKSVMSKFSSTNKTIDSISVSKIGAMI